jgi:hypothetical protein
MNSMKLNALALLALGGTLCQAASTNDLVLPQMPTSDRPLVARFENPPAAARILRILHQQHDNPDLQDKQLKQLAAQGFGGFVGNVNFNGYVDDETKWPAFLRGVRAAKTAGMSLWLYDECGYPSGSARDLTLRGHPEWAARGLLVAVTNSTGGAVTLALPPGQLVQAVALPMHDGVAALEQAQDLSAAVKNGQLTWQAPAGDWRVLAMTDDLIFEGTHAAVSLAFKKPCINLLMREPTARFLEVTHDQYAARLDQNLGRWFVSTFTDEPSLMNYWMRPMPYLVLPWSAALADEFQKRRGEKLLPVLPALIVEAGPRGAKARYDFWQTIAELVSENYFGQIQAWCHRHQLASGGHLLMEESFAGHVQLYGDFFRCARRLDAPSIDCLTSIPSEVPWSIARLLSSIADLEGRTITMCEVSDHCQRYRPKNDTRPVRVVTADEIRGTCNRLLWGGINTLTSYYSYSGLSDEQLRQLNLWIGRCSTMLAGGHQVSDIAVLYPIESLWPKFVPAHHGPTDAQSVRQAERTFDGAGSALFGANRDFTYVDSRALAEARVQGDALVHGKLRWRVVVLPATDTLPLAAWENLARFWRAGGVVAVIGARPANSEQEFPSPRVQALAKEIFGAGAGPAFVANAAGGVGITLPVGMLGLLPRLLETLIERDARAVSPQVPIKITHRRVENHDVYFAINDSAKPWSGTLQFPGKGVSELWDPATGLMTPLADGRTVAVQLGPYGGMLLRAAEMAAPRRTGGGKMAAPSFVTTTLPSVVPIIGKGQFVQAGLAGDATAGWTAAATVTKGGVDTHLFFSFSFPQPLDLNGSDGLIFDTTTPAAPQAGVELLVMLHTSNGGDYLASTGRMLNAPGTHRAHVLFTQFHRAGWSKGPDMPLDLAKVTAIRAGWGGHLGVEGEKLSFTVKLPQRFACGLDSL